jgi:hypothetical protein
MGAAREFLSQNTDAQRAEPMRPWTDSAWQRPENSLCGRLGAGFFFRVSRAALKRT